MFISERMAQWYAVLCVFLFICKQVASEKVISTGKTVQRSNVYDEDNKQYPTLSENEAAVDGNMSSCTTIRGRMQEVAWWMVDLGTKETINIISVTLPNSVTDITSLNGTTILIGAGKRDFKTYTKCGTILVDNYISSLTVFIFCKSGPVEGRYVAVLGANSTTKIKLCEVQVFRRSAVEKNLALGKHAIQSSTSNGGIANRAVDGNSNPSSNLGTCARTATGQHVYWFVDLGRVYRIQSIRIARSNSNLTDLYGSKIFVTSEFSNTSTSGLATCATISNTSFATDSVIKFKCSKYLDGNYVSIRKSFGQLSICEVEVFGFPLPFRLTNGGRGYIFHHEPMAAEDARRTCIESSGSLVTDLGSNKDMLLNKMKEIGLSQAWVNIRDSDCKLLNASSNGVHNQNCTSENGFICQTEIPQETTPTDQGLDTNRPSPSSNSTNGDQTVVITTVTSSVVIVIIITGGTASVYVYKRKQKNEGGNGENTKYPGKQTKKGENGSLPVQPDTKQNTKDPEILPYVPPGGEYACINDVQSGQYKSKEKKGQDNPMMPHVVNVDSPNAENNIETANSKLPMSNNTDATNVSEAAQNNTALYAVPDKTKKKDLNVGPDNTKKTDVYAVLDKTKKTRKPVEGPVYNNMC